MVNSTNVLKNIQEMLSAVLQASKTADNISFLFSNPCGSRAVRVRSSCLLFFNAVPGLVKNNRSTPPPPPLLETYSNHISRWYFQVNWGGWLLIACICPLSWGSQTKCKPKTTYYYTQLNYSFVYSLYFDGQKANQFLSPF